VTGKKRPPRHPRGVVGARGGGVRERRGGASEEHRVRTQGAEMTYNSNIDALVRGLK